MPVNYGPDRTPAALFDAGPAAEPGAVTGLYLDPEMEMRRRAMSEQQRRAILATLPQPGGPAYQPPPGSVPIAPGREAQVAQVAGANMQEYLRRQFAPPPGAAPAPAAPPAGGPAAPPAGEPMKPLTSPQPPMPPVPEALANLRGGQAMPWDASAQLPPGYVLLSGPEGNWAARAQPGQMTGREFEQQLTAGSFQNPANIHMADLSRYITYGSGIPGQTPEQRLAILQAASGLAGEGAQAAERLGNLGLRGVELLGAGGTPGRLQNEAAAAQNAAVDSRARLAAILNELSPNSRVAQLANAFAQSHPNATPADVQRYVTGLQRSSPQLFATDPAAQQVIDHLGGMIRAGATPPTPGAPNALAAAGLQGGYAPPPGIGAPPSSLGVPPANQGRPGYPPPGQDVPPPLGPSGPAPAGQAPAPPPGRPGANRPLPGEAAYAPIQQTLDAVAGPMVNRDGESQGPSGGVGEFLWRLNQTNPGFLQNNWDGVRAYIIRRWGTAAYERAAAGTGPSGQTPHGEYLTDYVPFLGGAVRGLGSIGHLTGAAPSEEIRGREALNALLRARGGEYFSTPLQVPLGGFGVGPVRRR